MAIDVTLGEVKPQKDKPFPKLMIGSELTLVLFYKQRIGTVISKLNSPLDVGEYYTEFEMSEFTDYNQPVTLQNK